MTIATGSPPNTSEDGTFSEWALSATALEALGVRHGAVPDYHHGFHLAAPVQVLQDQIPVRAQVDILPIRLINS